MARKRMLNPLFWFDEKIGTLSDGARLLFMGLWSFSDDEGIFIANPQLLNSTIFPYEKRNTEELLGELLSLNLIYCYEVGQQRYGIIINFRKHQSISHPQKSRLPYPSIEDEKYREALMKRDNHLCSYCKSNLSKNRSLASLVRKNNNESDLPHNLITSCLKCTETNKKENRTKKDFKKEERAQEFLPSSWQYQAAAELQKLILARDEKNKAKKADLAKWAIEIDKLHRIDERSIEDINFIIKESQKDLFWQNNILSAQKLRLQFDKLFLQFKGSKKEAWVPPEKRVKNTEVDHA